MRKQVLLIMLLCLSLILASCGRTGGSGAAQSGDSTPSVIIITPEAEPSVSPEAEDAAVWTREGYFSDEEGNMLSVAYMEMDDEKGWYVGFMNGEDHINDSYGGMLDELGNTLHGELPSGGDKEAVTVTVYDEGDEGVVLVVEGGETYRFMPTDLPEATIIVHINTEGMGNIEYSEGEAAPEIDTEYPYQSAQINLAEPAVYTFTAWPSEGAHFVKWMKDGEDLSKEATITVELAESAEYVAVFEEGEAAIDYLALVNKCNPLPEGWEDALTTVTITNSVGDEVEVEEKAFEAYEKLRADLEENDGIYIELDSARRSVETQQAILDDFTQRYGAEYAAKTVARPGYSEHHTGLALDLYFKLPNADGTFTDVYYNEDMVQYPSIWKTIHEKLAGYGFILRYPEEREHITGYGYEPWHIRYIDNPDTAREIMDAGLTLEEYLRGEPYGSVLIDYGYSELFTEQELYETVIQIKCKFAEWEGCELRCIYYAGDESSTEENVAYLNYVAEREDFTRAAEFLLDFRTPAETATTLDPDTEYTGYQWWYGFTEDGSFELVTRGY